MNLRQFEALYWIGRLGSFHAAARHLRTSQPAISARVRELELELGVVIFDRTERRAKPTPKGLELLDYAARVVGIVSEVRERIAAPGAISGRVRLGVTPLSALGWAPALIEQAAQSVPGITVALAIETSDSMRAQVERGDLDLAVVLGPAESPRLHREPLGSLAMGWVASPTLPLPEVHVGAADLASVPIITDRPGSHLFAAAMAWFREEGTEPGIHHACSSLPTRVHLAALGLGAALVATSAATAELVSRKVRLLPTRPVPRVPCALVWAQAGLSPQARLVAELVRLVVVERGGIDIRCEEESASVP